MINPSWTNTVSYHLNPGTNHKDLLSFIHLGDLITNNMSAISLYIVNLYNNTMICTNSDAMGHNCPTISHLAYSQSPELYTVHSNCWGKAFVSGFAWLSSDVIYTIITSPWCMIRTNRMNSRSMYLDHWWDHQFFSLRCSLAQLLTELYLI